MKLFMAVLVTFSSAIGFSLPNESVGLESSSCHGFLAQIDQDQQALVVESLKHDPMTQDVRHAHSDLILAKQSLIESVKTLRELYDRQSKFQLIRVGWIARRLARELNSFVLQGGGRRTDQMASLNSLLGLLSVRNPLNGEITSNALNYGEKLRAFEAKRRLVEDQVLLAFYGQDESGARLITERQKIEELLCQLDGCLKLAPFLGEQSYRLILESTDLFTGFPLISFGTWILGGTQYSARVKQFFEKLNKLEEAALPLGLDVRGFKTAEELGHFRRLFRAWSNNSGPMGGVDHQGFDLAWDSLLSNVGSLHSGNFIAKSVAQLPQILAAKKRMTMLELKLKLRDREIANNTKSVVCEILGGCDYDDGAAWDEVLSASGLK